MVEPVGRVGVRATDEGRIFERSDGSLKAGKRERRTRYTAFYNFPVIDGKLFLLKFTSFRP